MKFISFYYDKPGSNYYKLCYDNLSSRLNYLQLDSHIEHVEFDNSNYQNITLSKPSFILEKIYELKEPVIWIDIDCYFTAPFTDFSFLNGDVACFIREHDNITPHSALIYFNYNENSLSFLNEWNVKCQKYIDDSTYSGGDHCQLIETFKEFENKISISKIHNVCSVNHNTPIRIGISQGGIAVELNKK